MVVGQISTSTYLAELRKADGLVQVVRGFLNPAVPHPRGKINPADDINSMAEELILSDLVMLTARLEKLVRLNRTRAHFAEKFEARAPGRQQCRNAVPGGRKQTSARIAGSVAHRRQMPSGGR